MEGGGSVEAWRRGSEGDEAMSNKYFIVLASANRERFAPRSGAAANQPTPTASVLWQKYSTTVAALEGLSDDSALQLWLTRPALRLYGSSAPWQVLSLPCQANHELEINKNKASDEICNELATSLYVGNHVFITRHRK